MIVPTSAKVGIARFYHKNPAEFKRLGGVFVSSPYLNPFIAPPLACGLATFDNNEIAFHAWRVAP